MLWMQQDGLKNKDYFVRGDILEKLKRGYVDIYTGNGKGKTTAAIGQGVRACGSGLKVYMVQFLKTYATGELKSIKKLEPDFKIFRFEKKRDFFWNLNDDEKAELKEEVREAYDFCTETLKNIKCDVLIMDEIMGVIKNELLSKEDILKLIEIKPNSVELILTGRDVPDEIAQKADLITEMKEVKHYFNKGVPARKGIEF